MIEPIGIYVFVPVACFRVPRAREYFETFPVPPPATVYGMLLSLVGETNRRVHETAQIAVAVLSEPAYSVVLRTMWRVKNKNDGLGLGNNRRPDFQELLTDVKLAIWVRAGEGEPHGVSLAERVQNALTNPNLVNRFGGLSLGESTHLIDEVKLIDYKQIEVCQLLLNEDDGDLSLPVWVDHVGAASNWRQYRLTDFKINNAGEIPSNAWSTIERRPFAINSPPNSNAQPNLFEA